MSVKKRLMGFNASEDTAAKLKARAESLGLTMSDYLKGLALRDLDGLDGSPPPDAIRKLDNSPSVPLRRRTSPKSTKPTAAADVPEKFLGRDVIVLVAWFLGLLAIVQHVHPADVSLVATHYTHGEDTTRPEVLRQAVREVIAQFVRRLPTWARQAVNYLDRITD